VVAILAASTRERRTVREPTSLDSGFDTLVTKVRGALLPACAVSVMLRGGSRPLRQDAHASDCDTRICLSSSQMGVVS
jgi:hypothetical protein